MFYKLINNFVYRSTNLSRTVKCTNVRSMSVFAKSLKYCEYGDPSKVLELVEHKIEDPQEHEVLVKILASPINPADINIIQGKYPVKPKFPATGGNEFVGEVISLGSKVTKFSIGQRVIPFDSNLGTWSTHLLVCENNLMPVSSKIGIVEAATLTVNPCTAYRMLKDYVELEKGDCVIHNGANSAVGQAVHQICRAWDIKSVGIIRNRPKVEELKEFLKNLGAFEVLTEEEIRGSSIFKSNTINRPRLALNCVGGKSATEISRHLDNKGVLVTYGGMSREPVVASTAALIFKDISFRGFWMTRWNKENSEDSERLKMITELCAMIECGDLVAPSHELVPLEHFREATAAALDFKGFSGKKFILNMQS